MDYTLQLHGEKRVYPVPDGLNELMSDIAREVLRIQPTNIILFIADYLTALIDTRDATKEAVEVISNVFEKGEFYIQFLKDLGITKDEAVRAATIIQAAYRGYRVRKSLRVCSLPSEELTEAPEDLEMTSFLNERNLTLLQADTAATIIQKAYRGYASRKKYSLKHKALAWVRSHESWRDDWLWQEFNMVPEDLKYSLERKSTFGRSEREERLLPFRSVTLDRMKLGTLFDEQVMVFESDSLPGIATPQMEEKYILEERLGSPFDSEREETLGEAEESEPYMRVDEGGVLAKPPYYGETVPEGEWEPYWEKGEEGLEDKLLGRAAVEEQAPELERREEAPFPGEEETVEIIEETEEVPKGPEEALEELEAVGEAVEPPAEEVGVAEQGPTEEAPDAERTPAEESTLAEQVVVEETADAIVLAEEATVEEPGPVEETADAKVVAEEATVEEHGPVEETTPQQEPAPEELKEEPTAEPPESEG